MTVYLEAEEITKVYYVVHCDKCAFSNTTEEYMFAVKMRAAHEELHKFLETQREDIGSESQVYNPVFGDELPCACGHIYYRHFDPWEDMAPVGCKYCVCQQWRRP
jgi:hypothetical protein